MNTSVKLTFFASSSSSSSSSCENDQEKENIEEKKGERKKDSCKSEACFTGDTSFVLFCDLLSLSLLLSLHHAYQCNNLC